ncbi:hypothetical protein CEP88_01210 [Roseobacter denitrificans]|nr:hypothetical protein CEP88_01210 [Roseobacter denitrificans]
MKQKLGWLFEWELPTIVETVGPHDPSKFADFDEKRLALVKRVQDYLADLSDEVVDKLSDPETPSDDDDKSNWLRHEREAIRQMQKFNPPWYAGGFGHENYRADFEYWAQMSSFTNHEALLLSLGVEPKHFREEEVMNMQSQLERGDTLWLPLVYLLRRREQIERQFRSYGRGHKIDPKEFFEWAHYVQLDMHPEFHSHFVSTGKAQATPNANETDENLDPRVRSSMLKIIATMAVAGYTYNPRDKKSDVTSDIVNDASKLGISLTDDTVRKYLKLSTKMISKDWKPNNS